MPGLVGFAGRQYSQEANNHFLDIMADALEPEAIFKKEKFLDSDFGIARVTLGVTDSESHPIWNESRDVCICMEGELYDFQGIKQELIHKGHKFAGSSDAEILLHLFEEYGAQCAVRLNGAFIAAIWDQVKRKLFIINDRLGLYPLYYAQVNGTFLFSTGVRSLIMESNLPREVDQVAIAEILTFDHALHDHTLLKSVKLLQQATTLVYSDGQMKIESYWDFTYPEHYQLRSETEWMEGFLAVMRQAVKRQVAHDEVPAGILLSGGLDSRVLVAYLSDKENHQPIICFTWGIPGCDDARYAKEVSNILGAKYEFFELKPDWLINKANEAVRITDGLANIVNMHALANVDEQSKHTRVLYKGFLGDAMMGYGIRHQFWAEYDAQTTWQAHFQVHTDQNVISFNSSEQKELFTQSFQNNLGTAVIDDYILGMKQSGISSLADQRNYFDYRQRVPRMTIKGVEVVRSRAMVRLPFADNDLVEFSLSVPPGLRYQRRLMKNAFIKAFPHLAQVPSTENGLPMMACSREVLGRAEQLIRWHLNSRGLKWVRYPSRKPYADYNQWFRTILKDWLEHILLNKRALERGYYNPEFIRKLVTEHMQGKNHAVRLGELLSIELWHQQFLD